MYFLFDKKQLWCNIILCVLRGINMIFFLFYITVFFNLKYDCIPSNAIGVSVIDSSEIKKSLPQTYKFVSKNLKAKLQGKKDDLFYHLFKKDDLIQTFSAKSKQKKSLSKENITIFDDFFKNNENILAKTAVLFTKSVKNDLLTLSSSIESDIKNKLINNTTILFVTVTSEKQKLLFVISLKTNTAFAKEFTDMINLLFSFASKEHLVNTVTGSGYFDEKTEKTFKDIAMDIIYSLNFSYKDDLIVIKFGIAVKKAESGAKILADFKK